MLTENSLTSALNPHNNILTQDLHKLSAVEKVQQFVRYGLSSTLGALSAWYAFGKTANDGAKLIPLPFQLPLELRQNISFLGGAVLNGVLNSYFANKVLEKTSYKKFTQNKLKYSVVIATALLSTLPFIATAEITGEPWFAEVIEALAYSFIHFEGAEFLVDRFVQAINNTKTRYQGRADHTEYSLIDDINEAQAIIQMTEQSRSAILLNYCNNKRIPDNLPTNKTNFSDLLRFYKTEHVPTRKHQNNAQRLKILLIATNTAAMACALLGYYQMTAEKTRTSLQLSKDTPWNTPLGILAFTPFGGIVLKVIFAVSHNLAESAYSKQAENYYFNHRMAQLSFAISCVALGVIGWFSCATSLLLNQKYFADTSWYDDVAGTIAVPAAMATALFNTYPTVILLSQHIIKPLVARCDVDIARLNQFDRITDRVQKKLYHADKSQARAIYAQLNSNNCVDQPEVKNGDTIDITVVTEEPGSAKVVM